MAAATTPRDLLASLAGEVHVWLARPEAIGGRDRLAACRALLSDDETQRLARLRLEPSRRLFLVAHALARSALSHYAATPAGAWTFGASRWGRPEITGPGARSPLRFNLSHTHGLAACVVARDWDCGVDVEALAGRRAPERVARRVLAPSELAELETGPAEERRERFLTYWTLKEAYAKARGAGLSLPLRRFSFALGTGNIQMTCAAEDDDGAAWQFASLRPTPQHLLALALRRGAERERRVVLRELVPGEAARPAG